MSISTKLYTWLHGALVGTDQFGNRYYRAKSGAKRSDQKERRWVMYEGMAEASKVPPMWNAWLHHTVDAPPTDGGRAPPKWVKEHEPNLTGTAAAYRPPGDLMKGGHRSAATGDYEPWQPS
ncbi:MAG: NADH:ubiquinone oxidoreductase subunit NDUFA12 [Proteobacteria bacterium]|nr:NADH:ubiquinone oxidoreductase subunit NDUFA12 [Pseudomonadota bacterium]MBI3497967.1 NADH:ubiquinone oxidoreductase subunit NDUFA12 [Pseudomonadota bacterium]